MTYGRLSCISSVSCPCKYTDGCAQNVTAACIAGHQRRGRGQDPCFQGRVLSGVGLLSYSYLLLLVSFFICLQRPPFCLCNYPQFKLRMEFILRLHRETLSKQPFLGGNFTKGIKRGEFEGEIQGHIETETCR